MTSPLRGKGDDTSITADQFMQDGNGQCWARVHVGDGWQWQRVSHETFKQAARALDDATAELRDMTRNQKQSHG